MSLSHSMYECPLTGKCVMILSRPFSFYTQDGTPGAQWYGFYFDLNNNQRKTPPFEPQLGDDIQQNAGYFTQSLC